MKCGKTCPKKKINDYSVSLMYTTGMQSSVPLTFQWLHRDCPDHENVPQITYDVPCQIWKNDTPVSGLRDQIYQHWLTLPEIWKNQQTYKYQHGEYMGLNGTQNVSLRWFPNHTVIPQNNFVYDPWLKYSSMISKPPDPNTWSWYFVKSEFHYSTRLFFNQCNQSSIQRVKVLMQPKFYNIYHTTWWKPNH